MKRLIPIGLACMMFGTMAHAQRYDSSYGYEQRGFIPPDPVPRALRDYENADRAQPPIEPAQRQRRNRVETQR